MKKIPQYLLIRSQVNGFDFYHYLHIKGGSGIKYPHTIKSKYRSGGEYDYVLYFAAPEDEEKIGTRCPRKGCEELGIPYGEGETIQKAFSDYRMKSKGTEYEIK
jgi:hypothetical protein